MSESSAPGSRSTYTWLENYPELQEATATTEEEQATDPQLVAAKRLQELIEGGEKLTPELCAQEIAKIDVQLARQTNEILHTDEFQKLESAWRGLYYVVANADFRSGVLIDILDVSKADLITDLEETPDITRTGYYRHVYSDALGMYNGKPVATVVANYEFGPGQRDIKLLRKVSSVSAMAHAPFIASASPQMFGIESFEELPGLPDLADVFDSAKFAAWKGFREEEDARYVGLTMPRFLGRAVYTPDDVKRFTFEEDVSGSHEDFLWTNMSFAFAGRLTEAHAKSGWATNIIGPNSGGGVKGLPVHTMTVDGSEKMKVPTEVALTLRREYEGGDLGFIPLLWKKDTDQAAFFAAASTKKKKKFPNTEQGNRDTTNDFLGTQLPYMFTICRLTHYLKAIQIEQIGKGMTASMLERKLFDWIKQYVNEDAENETEMARCPLRHVELEVGDLAGLPGWYEVNLAVVPQFKYQGAHFTLSLKGQMDGTEK